MFIQWTDAYPYSVRFILNALYSSMFLDKRDEEGEVQVHLCSFCTSRIKPMGTLRATSRQTDMLNNCLVQPMSFKAQTRKLAEGKRGGSGGERNLQLNSAHCSLAHWSYGAGSMPRKYCIFRR